MINLDHAATTPVRPEVVELVARVMGEGLGNASSTHGLGRRARELVETAREQVATGIGATPHDIVFTSGGTESDNLAVLGLARAGLAAGRSHIVVSGVEHPAVARTVDRLVEHEGFAATVVAPRPDGIVAADDVLGAVRDDTALVTVMSANNELGTINDVATLGAALAATATALHVDAMQSMVTCDVDVAAWRVDALSLSAHKFGGPPGVGVAYVRRGVPIEIASYGGGQDRLRSGTFAAALIAGCGLAVSRAVAERPEVVARLSAVRATAVARLSDVDGIAIDGPRAAGQVLASHLHLTCPGVDGEALAFALDQAGLAVSTGSACAAGSTRASAVLLALQAADPTRLDGAPVRISAGWTTSARDVDRALDVLISQATSLRERGGAAVAGKVG